MRTWIKTSIAATILATAGLGAASVIAKPSDCEAYGPMAGMMGGHKMERGMMERGEMGPGAMRGGNMAERAGARLAELESALALRSDQNAAWQTFRQAVLDRAGSAEGRMGRMRGAERPGTALERMQRMEEHHAARLEAMTTMRATVESFYSQLDDGQKKTFDEQFMMGRGGHDDRKGRRAPAEGAGS